MGSVSTIMSHPLCWLSFDYIITLLFYYMYIYMCFDWPMIISLSLAWNTEFCLTVSMQVTLIENPQRMWVFVWFWKRIAESAYPKRQANEHSKMESKGARTFNPIRCKMSQPLQIFQALQNLVCNDLCYRNYRNYPVM